MAPLIRRKWNDRRGATMLIALLYVVVALAIGAMVLTAAYVNLGHIRRNETDQQNAQAVASAIRTARDMIEGKTYQAAWEQTTNYEEVPYTWTDPDTGEEQSGTRVEEQVQNPVLHQSNGLSAGSVQEPGVPFLPGERLSEVYQSHYVPDNLHQVAKEIDLPIKLDASTMDIPIVNGTLELVNLEHDSRGRDLFTLELTLYVEQNGECAYTTTLTVPAVVQEGSPETTWPSTDTKLVTHPLTVTWGKGTVVKGVPQ